VSEPPSGGDWEQALAQLEHDLAALKARYDQVQEAQRQQAELYERQARVREHLRRTKDRESQAELARLQHQLAELEVSLESQLLTWSSFKQPFWQAVRFGGLGFVLGVALHQWLS
jgi:chromosome segregation ATPase